MKRVDDDNCRLEDQAQLEARMGAGSDGTASPPQVADRYEWHYSKGNQSVGVGSQVPASGSFSPPREAKIVSSDGSVVSDGGSSGGSSRGGFGSSGDGGSAGG